MEAGVTDFWWKYRPAAVVGIDRFGESAPASVLAIGIMAHTSYEWTLIDFAAWEAGLVVVPIYETSSAEQARWIITDAAVRLVVVEDAAMETVLTTLAATAPELDELQVLSIAKGAVTDLMAAGASADSAADADLDARSARLRSTDLEIGRAHV